MTSRFSSPYNPPVHIDWGNVSGWAIVVLVLGSTLVLGIVGILFLLGVL